MKCIENERKKELEFDDRNNQQQQQQQQQLSTQQNPHHQFEESLREFGKNQVEREETHVERLAALFGEPIPFHPFKRTSKL